MKPFVRRTVVGVAALLVVIGAGLWYVTRKAEGHPSALVPRDTSLRTAWLYFYPSRASGAPKAFVVLFGNDIAFWEPHQNLAWRLSGDGYPVVGIDARALLATLPSSEPQRDSAFGAALPGLIARARHELGADSLPIIVGGHSFGAELAFWIAWHVPPPRLIGVLALNTRSTGHLFITAGDLLNHEANDAWSFSTIDAVKHIDPAVRIAIVRGEHDPFRQHDPEFIAAGGARVDRIVVPYAGHALKTMILAGPLIMRAVRFLTDGVR
jgi:pimeloyl-ACP methyl ester carboxylesterase